MNKAVQWCKNQIKSGLPLATLGIIALNVILFFGGFQKEFAFDGFPGNIFNGLGAMFSHANFGHLFGNMLFLIFLGPKVEKHFGFYKFIVFYLFCGFASGVGYGILWPANNCLGASGAISGVFAAYPFCIKRLPYMLIAGIISMTWFVHEFMSMSRQLADITFDMTAHAAHVAGGVSGILLFLFNELKGRKTHK